MGRNSTHVADRGWYLAVEDEDEEWWWGMDVWQGRSAADETTAVVAGAAAGQGKLSRPTQVCLLRVTPKKIVKT